MDIHELHVYISERIQGVFGEQDILVLKKEIQKLKPGDVYVEIGVDEGRSARAAHEYADKEVYKIWIDIHDPTPRGPFMEKEEMVGMGRKGFYVHGGADEFAEIFPGPIKLMFIDGSHDYDSVKKNTLMWEDKVKGVILFHDYDHPGVKQWTDEHYGDNKEVLHGKMVRIKR